MILSKRLSAIANEVPHYASIADIGTDHAYLPIYLYKLNKIKKAIATDINKGPLEKAKNNIMSHQADRIIETRLGNGLEVLKENEVDTIILAGMGGMLIIDILKKRPEIVENIDRLIIQPQLDQNEVRKYLHSINHKIINEQLVYEDNKYYWIMSSEAGKEKYDKEIFYLYSKILIEKKDPILKQYIEKEIKKNKNILERLNHPLTEHTLRRKKEIEKNIRDCEEVLLWL
ncbi:MAG TPA: class I SAM-dependent methyltransferase [Defluviitaleaceae bacterium]|nr:SAM-dependent methyltransferase [Candidatus Epulonipiscium sp.]HQD49794.1 class I SAM-dependent methyltransferase [Defluviitaleaceae bacterium]